MDVASSDKAPVSWARVIGRILVGGLVVGAFALVVGLALFPPSDAIRQYVTEAVTRATGRPFSFAGDPTFSFSPRPMVTLQRVALGAPPQAPGPETLRAEKLDVAIDPMSLLSGRIGVDHITVTRAALTLRPEDAALVPQGGSAPSRVEIREVRIVDSSLNYLVTHPNPSLRIDQMSLTLAGLADNGPVKATGRLRWRGEMVEVDGSVGSLSALASAAGAPVKLTTSSRRLAATFDGQLAPKAPDMLVGKLEAKAGAARDVLRWLGDMDFGAYALPGPATLDGRVAVSGGVAKLEKAALKLDAGDGQWDVQFTFGGAKPRIDGTIAWRELDLLKLTGETPVPAAAAAALEARPRPVGPVVESAWDSLAETLAGVEAAATGAAAPTPKKTEKTTGWSTKPLDLSGLAAADVDLVSSASVLKYGRIDLRNSQTHLGIKDGKLAYTVRQVEIGGGRADGKLELDGGDKQARVAVTMRAADVPAESVLSQLFKSLLVSGATKLDVGVEGRGRTPQDIISSLTGKADLKVQNGAFHGFDLRRTLLTWWRPQKFDPSSQTKIQSISGQFAMANGVLRTAAPLTVDGDVRMTAEGSVEIARRSLDQNVRIRVSPPPEHIAIPVRVTGNWTEPKIAWDWRSVFESNGLLGSPLGLVPAGEPIPPELKAQIERVLTGPAAGSLAPETRQMLETIGGS